MTTETKQCTCGGTMYHSDDMENPFAGSCDRTPFWQCEQCGELDDSSAPDLAADLARLRTVNARLVEACQIVRDTAREWLYADGSWRPPTAAEKRLVLDTAETALATAKE